MAKSEAAINIRFNLFHKKNFRQKDFNRNVDNTPHSAIFTPCSNLEHSETVSHGLDDTDQRKIFNFSKVTHFYSRNSKTWQSIKAQLFSAYFYFFFFSFFFLVVFLFSSSSLYHLNNFSSSSKLNYLYSRSRFPYFLWCNIFVLPEKKSLN